MKVLVAIALLFASYSPVRAAVFSIDYQVTNTSGSTYRYDYTLSGGPATTAPLFIEIVFPSSLFSNLANPTYPSDLAPVAPDVDIIPIDTVLSLDGYYLIYPQINTVFTSKPFSVEVDLNSGQTLPLSQVFNVYSGTTSIDIDGDLFDVPALLETGTTTLRRTVDPPNVIPEPSSVALLAIGFVWFGVRKHRNR